MVEITEHPMPEMVERMIFPSDIARPLGSDEYRFWHREPRLQLVYNFVLHEARFAQLEETIYDNIDASWDVPFWHERTRNLDITIGQTVIAVDTDAEYQVGEKVMIWQACDTYELGTVQTVGAGSVTLSSGASASYTNAAVMPCRTGFIAAPMEIGRRFRGLLSFQITFEMTNHYDISGSPWGTYSSYEILSCASGYLSPLTGSIVPNVEYYGQRLGPVVIERGRDEPDFGYAVEIANHAWDLKQFLYQIAGRDYPFWTKIWGGQMTPQAASSGSGTITVNGTRPVADLANRHIFIDGQYRQISSASDNTDGTQTLTLSANLSANVAAGAPVSLIQRCRVDSETISISHNQDMRSSRALFPIVEDKAA